MSGGEWAGFSYDDLKVVGVGGRPGSDDETQQLTLSKSNVLLVSAGGSSLAPVSGDRYSRWCRPHTGVVRCCHRWRGGHTATSSLREMAFNSLQSNPILLNPVQFNSNQIRFNLIQSNLIKYDLIQLNPIEFYTIKNQIQYNSIHFKSVQFN